MQLSLTFRHMEPSDALKAHVQDKLDRIKKYFPNPIRAQVVLAMERYRHQVDVNITLHNGLALKGKESTDDMYTSIDLVMDKIETQVRRYKDKIQAHRPITGPEVPVHYGIMTEHAAEEDEVSEKQNEISSAHKEELKIIKSQKFMARPMLPAEAVMQMNLLNDDFLVFTNATTNDVNVVYKRSDGHYGLIETGRSAEDRG